MTKKIFNNFALLLLFTIIFFTYKSFLGNVTFGHGLGDIFSLPFLWLTTFSFLLSTVINRKKEKQLLISNIIFTILVLWILLRVTILRGGEYSWNGEIFIH